MKRTGIFFVMAFLFMGELVSADTIYVRNSEQLQEALIKVKPGDEIVLANGVWQNTEIKVRAEGTREQPIVIRAEEKGKVFLEGQSHLKIGGRYIMVTGLVFRNGYTASSSVISFRADRETKCHHCRVSECVIDNYNPPERFDQDYWVEIHGTNNRFDHNYLVGKRNRGVTLAVRLRDENDRNNYHRIDHNYFGYHPVLGSNGGETLRIGTSHHSMSNSNTIVEDNYFEHCNGEHEIISNKSCRNSFINNTFYECQGTLTMRHGNETLVRDNYFFGNGKANTGGIRIINESQTVLNNYCEGLTGYRFRGALVVMNGVPDSPLNRYFQVRDSRASGNLFINCDYIQLCAGSDAERSATPVDSEISRNIFYNKNKDDIFTVYDDISGIDFNENYLSKNIVVPHNKGSAVKQGFEHRDIEFTTVNGIKRAVSFPDIGPGLDRPIPTRDNTGVQWYPRKDYMVRFDAGRNIQVYPGENTLLEAVKGASSGDILNLAPGSYHMSKAIDITFPITIKGLSGDKPHLTFERSSLFNIENGGSLKLQDVNISGDACDDYAGNSVIRTSRYSMIDNYKLILDNCDFRNLDVNHSFNVLRVFKNTFADSILVRDCNFKNITGHVFNLDKEIEDTGIYNVENFVIASCRFKNVGGSAVKLYRGGRDESTFGPIVTMDQLELKNVGRSDRNKNASSLELHGVQYADISNIRVEDSEEVRLHLLVGEPVIRIDQMELINSGTINSNSKAYEVMGLQVKNAEDK